MLAFRHHPWRAVYFLAHTVVTLLVRLPVWVVLSVPRAWRPRPTWTIKRTLIVTLMRHAVQVSDRVRVLPRTPQHETILQRPGVKSLWIEPTPELIHGAIATCASVAGVAPVRILGYWLDKPGLADATPAGAPHKKGEKVMYRLHGGGYVALSARPDNVEAQLTRDLLRLCKSFRRAFAVEYRLSSGAPLRAANPFPAALLDAVAGWAYLTRVLGIPARDVYLVGDSAGGNLALALARYLVESQSHPERGVAGVPGGMILVSPWADVGTSHEGKKGSSMDVNRHSDYLPNFAGASYSKLAFSGQALGFGAAHTNAYISPASLLLSSGAGFEGFPRTYLCARGAEVLLDSIRTLRARMERDMGTRWEDGLTYDEKADAVHVYPGLPFHEPERTETLDAIRRWVEDGE